jgi:hypothetical protein
MDVGLFVGYLPLVSQVYYKLHYEIHRIASIVYSNIWPPYLVKVRMSVAILSHISGNVVYACYAMFRIFNKETMKYFKIQLFAFKHKPETFSRVFLRANGAKRRSGLKG